MQLFLQMAVILLISTGFCHGQSTITSPAAGSRLGHPGFTLTWFAVNNADEYQISLGSAQGKTDYFQGSMDRQSSTSFNWPGNRPAGVKPAQNDKYNAVMNLLRKIQKGDTLQFVMRKRTKLPTDKTSSYAPHTIAFRAAYVSDGTAMDWVDSNLNGDGLAYAGTVWPWKEARPPHTPSPRHAHSQLDPAPSKAIS